MNQHAKHLGIIQKNFLCYGIYGQTQINYLNNYNVSWFLWDICIILMDFQIWNTCIYDSQVLRTFSNRPYNRHRYTLDIYLTDTKFCVTCLACGVPGCTRLMIHLQHTLRTFWPRNTNVYINEFQPIASYRSLVRSSVCNVQLPSTEHKFVRRSFLIKASPLLQPWLHFFTLFRHMTLPCTMHTRHAAS